MNRKIQKRHVHELVAEEIQKYIEEKNLQEGDKLPSVEELTQLFGVGRSSLREALRYLEAMDIVQVVNGKGIYVKDIGSFRYSGTVKIDNEKKFLLYVLDVRRALEGKAVELAARNIDSDMIDKMRACLEEYDDFKSRGLNTAAIDYEFHQLIYEAAANPLLNSVFESISELYGKFFSGPFGVKELFDDTYPFHRTLFEGLVNHDAEHALREFHKMMDIVEEAIRKYEQS
ncbi:MULTISPECIES: FadR/GntR family transcriptional regulator [Paenibacillus]|uniref:FCD domain-containing protein n=1 Tax=Paenibacillus campinasensis TaxID=66347 RepID=A0ABW9T9P8_9BACL|nr:MULTISPECIES: FadR/GntR family transcriptional regulator [Paenibacillus]MUG68840.1 FCD domain-containing protein [Paenibacillus campinasensis]PAK54927.1 GntR family transcriptional regulator [Paenibacillus sp. 7541]